MLIKVKMAPNNVDTASNIKVRRPLNESDPDLKDYKATGLDSCFYHSYDSGESYLTLQSLSVSFFSSLSLFHSHWIMQIDLSLPPGLIISGCL